MMTARSFTERDIHLALDGELPAEERDAYGVWLAANPDMKARAERFAEDAALLRAALAGVLDEPVPPRLARSVSGGRALAGRAWWQAAAAAAILAVGLAAGYALGIRARQPSPTLAAAMADRAIAAHDIYAAEKLHVVEVGADQKEHLIGWLSKRLGAKLVAPDLTAQGYSLVGGRLLPAAHRTAAQFMYQDHDGTRISLYVVRDPSNDETGFRLMEEGATRALYWMDDGFGCAVAGDVSEEALTEIANVAYRQLLEGLRT